MEKNFKNAFFMDNMFHTIIRSRNISVNNCGYTYIPQKSASPYKSFRPNGTNDYQLLFVEQGENHMEFPDRKFLLKAGNLLLIPPNIYQKYYVVAGKAYMDYWLHFSGESAPALIEMIGLSPLEPATLENSFHFTNAVTSLALQMHLRQQGYEIKCLSLFYDIFYTLFTELVANRQSPHYFRIKAAIEYIYHHYDEFPSIKKLADECSLSVSRFHYLFKAEIGKTAVQYITDMKIEKASQLLMQTDYTVSEIAHILGYEDALYFSKVFKRLTGKSPTEFRSNKKQNKPQ